MNKSRINTISLQSQKRRLKRISDKILCRPLVKTIHLRWTSSEMMTCMFRLTVTSSIMMYTKVMVKLRSNSSKKESALLHFLKVDKNQQILLRGLLIRISRQMLKAKHSFNFARGPALIVCLTRMADLSMSHLNSLDLFPSTSKTSVCSQVKMSLSAKLIGPSFKSLSLPILQAFKAPNLAKTQKSMTLKNRCKSTKSFSKTSSIRVTVSNLCITNTRVHLSRLHSSLLKANLDSWLGIKSSCRETRTHILIKEKLVIRLILEKEVLLIKIWI